MISLVEGLNKFEAGIKEAAAAKPEATEYERGFADGMLAAIQMFRPITVKADALAERVLKLEEKKCTT